MYKHVHLTRIQRSDALWVSEFRTGLVDKTQRFDLYIYRVLPRCPENFIIVALETPLSDSKCRYVFICHDMSIINPRNFELFLQLS